MKETYQVFMIRILSIIFSSSELMQNCISPLHPKLNYSINKKLKKMKKVILILVAVMFSTVMFAQTQDTKKAEPKKEPAKTEIVKPVDKRNTAAPVKPVKKQATKKKIVKKVPPQATPGK